MTSFLDGDMPHGGPGWYFINYLQHYSAKRLTDQEGNRSPLANQKVEVDVDMVQVAYFSPNAIGDMHLGWTVLAPAIINQSVNIGPVPTPAGPVNLSGKSGLGDITIGPMFQFKTVVGPNGPIFAQRIELDFLLPTGRYNQNVAVNPGSNFWSFNPHWAATYWLTPKWSASTRLHYIYNSKNKDVAGGGSLQAGQAVHANITTEYAVTPQFRVGLNGYWLNQFTDTKIDGVAQPGRRDRVWAIGPGLLYNFSKDDALFFNAYFERGAKNVAEGNRFVLRYAHHF
jgi:anthranilate 1,2-dioxygenase (deaminating, decarboxylating) large subunit